MKYYSDGHDLCPELPAGGKLHLQAQVSLGELALKQAAFSELFAGFLPDADVIGVAMEAHLTVDGSIIRYAPVVIKRGEAQ